MRQASVRGDEDSVHDLRVAVRRLRECLRMFKESYPPAGRKKVRAELKELMNCAELVRSADIALELMKKAGLDDAEPHVLAVREQRLQHSSALHEVLKAFSARPYTRTWREALRL